MLSSGHGTPAIPTNVSFFRSAKGAFGERRDTRILGNPDVERAAVAQPEHDHFAVRFLDLTADAAGLLRERADRQHERQSYSD
jgi:hypothetical protein